MKNYNEEGQEVDLIKRKVQFFFENNSEVHIVLKANKRFRRGLIKYVGADFLLLDERFDGEMPIFFLEIHKIDKCIPKELWKKRIGEIK